MTDEAEYQRILEESSSVQIHLGIFQRVIERTAVNSTSAKTWCITIVSAIMVVTVNKDKPNYAFIALFPVFVFAVLDAYYLAMEKGFRNSYNQFVEKIHNNTATTKDLFWIIPVGKKLQLRLEAVKSFSIWGFYIGLVVLVFLTRTFIL